MAPQVQHIASPSTYYKVFLINIISTISIVTFDTIAVLTPFLVYFQIFHASFVNKVHSKMKTKMKEYKSRRWERDWKQKKKKSQLKKKQQNIRRALNSLKKLNMGIQSVKHLFCFIRSCLHFELLLLPCTSNETVSFFSVLFFTLLHSCCLLFSFNFKKPTYTLSSVIIIVDKLTIRWLIVESANEMLK